MFDKNKILEKTGSVIQSYSVKTNCVEPMPFDLKFSSALFGWQLKQVSSSHVMMKDLYSETYFI